MAKWRLQDERVGGKDANVHFAAYYEKKKAGGGEGKLIFLSSLRIK